MSTRAGFLASVRAAYATQAPATAVGLRPASSPVARSRLPLIVGMRTAGRSFGSQRTTHCPTLTAALCPLVVHLPAALSRKWVSLRTRAAHR